MKHEQLDESARELAALYAMGTMTVSEAEAYDVHLAECPSCRAAVTSLEQTVDLLHYAPPEVTPPADLRERMQKRLFGGRPVIVPATAPDWRATGFPGVEVRYLFADEQAGRVTYLVRMAAMSAYPVHRHAGPEECYVLEGDVNDGTHELHAGDYSRFPRGSEHGPLSTKTGCLLFLQSSPHDEVLG